MGIGNALRLIQSAEDLATNPANYTTGIRSPWITGNLSKIITTDIFGETGLGPITRAEAMAIPAIARGRHKLVTAIARGVLLELEGDTPVTPLPAWLSRTDGRTSPQHRVAWTVDDLIFSGWSLWGVARAGSDPFDPITDAARAPRDSWQITPEGVVQIKGATGDWEDVEDESTVILIPGFHEGLLEFGTRTIRAARNLEETAAAQASNPIPAVELHQTTDDEMTDDEIDALVDAWTEAIQQSGGAVAYTPKSIEVRVHGTNATDLLIQGRNAAAIDAARIVGLPATTIDASNVNSTLTYETTQGRNLEFQDDSISLYADPIAARLSMDDVCPPSHRVAFDFSAVTALAPSATGPNRQD